MFASAKESFPEFGTDEFWEFFSTATEDELKDWYDSIKIDEEDVATESDADYPYPEYTPISEDPDFESDFWEWFIWDVCKDGSIDYDLFMGYLSQAGFQDAKSALTDANELLATMGLIAPLAQIGDLFPADYGNIDGFSGRGTEENPYLIENVDDSVLITVYTG